MDKQADAVAIDSQVFDTIRRTNPDAAAQLRVVAILGPSTIPPIVVAKSVDAELKRQFHEILIALHYDYHTLSQIGKDSIERFVPVTDEHYQDIHNMFRCVQPQL